MKVVRDCMCASDIKICVALSSLPLSVACMAPGN